MAEIFYMFWSVILFWMVIELINNRIIRKRGERIIIKPVDDDE